MKWRSPSALPVAALVAGVLIVVGGLAAMASLAAVPLSGTRLAAAAPPAGLGQPDGTRGQHGRPGPWCRRSRNPHLSRAARVSKP